MTDEDVLEQARAAGLTIATGVSRLGDTFIRAAQQRAEADVRDKQLHVEDAQHRYEAQAQVAEQLYRRAGDPDWMHSVDRAEAQGVWEAAQIWADLDQERFREAAGNVTTAYRQAYGTDPTVDAEDVRDHSSSVGSDYDSPEARSQRTTALVDAGWPTEAVHARAVSDNLNAVDPMASRSRRGGGVSAGSDQVRNARPTGDRIYGHER